MSRGCCIGDGTMAAADLASLAHASTRQQLGVLPLLQVASWLRAHSDTVRVVRILARLAQLLPTNATAAELQEHTHRLFCALSAEEQRSLGDQFRIRCPYKVGAVGGDA